MKYTIDYFKTLAKDKGGECLSNSYKNGKTKLEFKCFCGEVWSAQPRYIVKGSWCPHCGHQKGRLYDVDHAFFSRDNEASFYVAGFLAADGWKTKKSGGGFSVCLTLAVKDESHIRLIKDLMKCTSPLKFRTRKNLHYKENTTNKKNCLSYTFIANSKQLYSDLEKFGVVENKTYIMKMNDWLINHPLVHHFMRGYIDGDGSFTNIGPDNHIQFHMRGTKIFLDQFHSILLKNGVAKDEKIIEANAGKKEKVFGILRYNGNVILSKMYNFLYKDTNYFLNRKEEIVKKACDLVVYGDVPKKRKSKKTALSITKEKLLEKARDLKSATKIGKYFGCTAANISWWAKNLGIQDEYRKIIIKTDCDVVLKRYGELKNYSAVAKEIGITRERVSQIVKKYNK